MFVNLAYQWTLTSSFIGVAYQNKAEYSFLNYGLKYMDETQQNTSQHMSSLLLFPTITSCFYSQYGSGGDPESTNAICILPYNIINDKIFLLIWFWFAFLTLITFYKFVYRWTVFLFSRARYNVLNYEVDRSIVNTEEDRQKALKFLTRKHSDLV